MGLIQHLRTVLGGRRGYVDDFNMSLAEVHKRPFWEIFIVWDCWVFEKSSFFQILILKILVSCFTEMWVGSSPPKDSNFLLFLKSYFVATITNDFNVQYGNIRLQFELQQA